MKKVKENPALSYMTWNFYLISEIVNKILILERRLYPFTYKIIVYLQVIYQKKKLQELIDEFIRVTEYKLIFLKNQLYFCILVTKK